MSFGPCPCGTVPSCSRGVPGRLAHPHRRRCQRRGLRQRGLSPHRRGLGASHGASGQLRGGSGACHRQLRHAPGLHRQALLGPRHLRHLGLRGRPQDRALRAAARWPAHPPLRHLPEQPQRGRNQGPGRGAQEAGARARPPRQRVSGARGGLCRGRRSGACRGGRPRARRDLRGLRVRAGPADPGRGRASRTHAKNPAAGLEIRSEGRGREAPGANGKGADHKPLSPETRTGGCRTRHCTRGEAGRAGFCRCRASCTRRGSAARHARGCGSARRIRR